MKAAMQSRALCVLAERSPAPVQAEIRRLLAEKQALFEACQRAVWLASLAEYEATERLEQIVKTIQDGTPARMRRWLPQGTRI